MDITTTPPATSRAAPTDGLPGRVLVVDDEPSVRKFVAKVLSRVGHQVAAAKGVDEALERLAGESYDVLLIDLEMPGRNGLELLEQILLDGTDVICILLTGTPDVSSAVTGMKRGAFDYLAKPVDPDPLCWSVARGLGLARARRRERSLERIASEWASTFEACPDMLIVLDPEGRILRANNAVGRRLGVETEGLPGRLLQDALPGRLGTAVADVRAGETTGEAFLSTILFDHTLGGHFQISVNRLKAIGGSARGSVVVARDVTDQVEAESARVRLLRRVLTAQEDERRRIAKELHDGLGQALVSLAVGLATITPESTAAEVRERVERLGQIAAETLQDVRRLTRGLRPMVLDDLGLLTALSRLTELFTQVHGVQASFVARGRWLEQLPGEVESALYRIAQEALANIAKHADAKTVAMTLEDVNDSICLCLTDDGRGFRNQPARRGVANEGFGISGMRERASILGGSFRIDSALGVGTTIHVCIPIKGGKP